MIEIDIEKELSEVDKVTADKIRAKIKKEERFYNVLIFIALINQPILYSYISSILDRISKLA